MSRVAIIGSPGTGKSTFARKLAGQTGLPLIHLDFYYHDKKHDYYHDKIAWRARANEMAEADRWIIDGNFGATMPRRLARADTVFYFDMPTYRALCGIVKRWVTSARVDRPDMPSGWQEKPSWELFWKVVRFRKKNAQDTRTLLRRNQKLQVVTFKNHRQIDQYLSNYGNMKT